MCHKRGSLDSSLNYLFVYMHPACLHMLLLLLLYVPPMCVTKDLQSFKILNIHLAAILPVYFGPRRHSVSSVLSNLRIYTAAVQSDLQHETWRPLLLLPSTFPLIQWPATHSYTHIVTSAPVLRGIYWLDADCVLVDWLISIFPTVLITDMKRGL